MKIETRWIHAGVFVACVGLIAYAMVLQHFMDLEPCPMCILQRYAFVGVGLLALLAAIHDCVERYGYVDYFPSYEIVLDELRDYRFFNEDMLHPNEVARKIVFQRFVDTYFSEEAHRQIVAAEKQYRSSLHRSR